MEIGNSIASYASNLNFNYKRTSADTQEYKTTSTFEAILKERELVSSNDNVRFLSGAVEEIDPDLISKNRQAIGMTSYPVSDMLSNVVIAFVPPESTAKDPIVQISMEESDGKHTYNIHVNKVNPKSASDMEMFAYLSYQGYIGNTIPGAINNYSAYKTLKYQDGLDTYGEFKELFGERYFTSVKSDVKAIIERVYSWMKTIDDSNAKKQTVWCEELLKMLESSGNC